VRDFGTLLTFLRRIACVLPIALKAVLNAAEPGGLRRIWARETSLAPVVRRHLRRGLTCMSGGGGLFQLQVVGLRAVT
jgi:hypothetical protein